MSIQVLHSTCRPLLAASCLNRYLFARVACQLNSGAFLATETTNDLANADGNTPSDGEQVD
jgi:hypothetical protein